MVNVMAKCKINDLPAEEIQANTDQLITSIKSQAESYGMDYATYIKLYYGYDDEDEFAKQVYEICQESLREKMVMCAIAKAENVTVTDQETEDYLNDYAKNNNVDVDSIKNSITDLDIKYNALAYKVMNDVLYKNAKAVDSTTTAATTEDTTVAE